MIVIFEKLENHYRDYFTVEGRITRETYFKRIIGRWAGLIVMAAVYLILAFILGLAIYQLNKHNFWIYEFLILFGIPCIAAVGIVFTSVFVIVKIFQEVKRLRDLNIKWGWFVLGIIPVVNIVYYLYLIFKNGTIGENRYGEDPKNRT